MSFERTEAKLKELVRKKVNEYLEIWAPLVSILPREAEELLEDLGYSCLLTGLELQLGITKQNNGESTDETPST